MFQVRWAKGDITWQSEADFRELKAPDRHLEFQGIQEPWQLPK